jgi:hypothetical protein
MAGDQPFARGSSVISAMSVVSNGVGWMAVCHQRLDRQAA